LQRELPVVGYRLALPWGALNGFIVKRGKQSREELSVSITFDSGEPSLI
jgi:hypothetical protein